MVLLEQSIQCLTRDSHNQLNIQIPDVTGLSATADLFLFLLPVPWPIVPSVPLVAQESYNPNRQQNLHNITDFTVQEKSRAQIWHHLIQRK